MAQENLPLSEHLEELRWRLLRSSFLLLLTTFLSCFFVKSFLRFLIQPLGKTFYLSPSEAVLVHLKVALFLGFSLGFPYFLWEAWRFVSAGLLPDEKKFFFIYFPFALLAFFAGLLFAFFIVLPLCLRFFLSFGSDSLQPMISIGSYVSFMSGLVFSFGLTFELPVVILFLSHLGLVTPSFLMDQWRYIVVAIFVIAAVVTPPDVLSQMLLALPLLVLYGMSLFLSHLGSSWRKGRRV